MAEDQTDAEKVAKIRSMIVEYRKGCGNGPAGTCLECAAAFMRVIGEVVGESAEPPAPSLPS